MKALREQARLTERTTSAVQATRLTRVLHCLGVLTAVAGLILELAPVGAHAQNAAQRAALAQLGRLQARAHPNDIGSEAASVPLSQPHGLAFDTAGNLYIADTSNNIVREVNLAGVITTVAGTGEQGYGGDSGPATSALLDSPVGVVVDSAGNIYIGDTHNNRVREVVASSGNIVTVAGTGVAGFSGDGGAATSAMLARPTAVAVDSSGNIYVADTNNHRIREISGTTITTVAGDGEQFYSGDGGLATAAGLNSPDGVAVDAAFNIYIGDTNNQRVRMVAAGTGMITTIAGTGVKGFTADGPAGSAALARPQGVAVDASGKVYLADSDNDRIRTINSGTVTTIAGSGAEGFAGDSGASTGASLDTPGAVAVSGTTVLLSDTENNRVRQVNSGTIQTIAGQAPPQTESLAIGGPLSAVYGTGTLTAAFSNGTNTGTGRVTFYDGLGANPVVIGSALLSGNSAPISASALSAGTHDIVASYAGDANNAPITSGVYVFVVTPAQLSAVANTLSLLYGQAIPTLTGTLSGVLPQDAGNVTAVFSTTATSTSAPGTYPIAVTLTGSAAGNYTVALGAGSGSMVIAQAPTTTTLTAGSTTPVLGTSVTLTATVASTTSGTPGGTVNFFNSGALLNATPATLTSGVATLDTTTLPVGPLSLTAVYSGNTDFVASTSSPLTLTELAPDFSITAAPAAQTVLPTQSVNYTINLTPANPTFVYPVSLSASGLPEGVTATFAPSSIAAGAGASTVTLTLSASGQAELRKSRKLFGGLESPAAFALLLLPLIFGRRARKTAARLSRAGKVLIALLALAVVSAIAGCGGGGYFIHPTKSYTVTVTAVSGPNTHSTDVTLTVQ
jgi:sugar lactone lactonase YvrE